MTDSNDLAIYGEVGGGGGGHVPFEADDTLSSKQKVKLLFAVSEGEIEDIEYVLVNNVNLDSYDATWEFRPGTANQSVIDGFVDTEQPIAAFTPTELTQDTDFFASVPYDAAACRITLTSVFLKQINSLGDTLGYIIQFDLATRPSASSLWTSIATITKDGKSSSSYSWDTRVPRPDNVTIASSWEIRLTRLTVDDDSKHFSVTSWSSAIAIRETNLNYGNTALVSIILKDAEQFGGKIPEIAFKIKGVKVKVPSNYNAATFTYDELTPWDGSLTEGLFHYTANPAWHIYNTLNNARYGLGQPKADIDVISLYNLSKYCDELVDDGKGGLERRFSLNNQFYTRENAPTFLTFLLNICNANFTTNEFGQISVMFDRPGQSVTKQVNNSNVIDGEFVYSSSDLESRYNLVNVTYNREEFNGKTDTATQTEDTLLGRYGLQSSDVVLPGCTSEGQAVRKARWAIYNTSYLPNIISYKLLFSGLTYHVGELVRVFDADNQGSSQDGVIQSSSQNSTSTTLELDRQITLANDVYTVYFMNLDGKTEEEYTILETNSTVSSVSFVGLTQPAANGVFLLSGAIAPKVYKVIKNDKDEDIYTIIAVEHNENKYNYIDDIPLLPNPSGDFVNVSEFLTTVVTNINVVENFTSNGVTKNSTLDITWDWTKGSSRFEAGFLLSWRRDNQESNFINDIQGKSHSIVNPVPGTYEIAVWAISPFSGIKSAPVIFVYNFRVDAAESSLQPPVNVFVAGTSGLTFNTQDILFSLFSLFLIEYLK